MDFIKSIMKRHIEIYLTEWKESPNRLPLILRGARQTGKTFIVEKFGATCFDIRLTVNFELRPELKTAFTSLDPNDIITRLELMTNVPVIPGKTLLFLDEIQECPEALMALRYFKENKPDLHVIAAGSLLEFTLQDDSFRMPVGRVQFAHMHPLSFQEFLDGTGHSKLAGYLNTVTLDAPPDNAIHNQLLHLVRQYMGIGGMPAAAVAYLATRSVRDVQTVHASLLASYEQDFGKYGPKIDYALMRRIFQQSPKHIGQRFKYVDIAPDIRSEKIKEAIILLEKAGLLDRIHAVAASGLPLGAHVKENRFKLRFLDVGLAQHANKLDLALYMSTDLLAINNGAIAEQFAGQELIAAQPPHLRWPLYFWYRDKKNSQAEVDFVIQTANTIVPIEVKAGKTGRLKSLHLFMEEKNSPLGVRISSLPLSLEKNILSIPLYLTSQVERLIKACLS